MEPKHINRSDELYELFIKKRSAEEVKLWLLPQISYYCVKYPVFIEEILRKYVILDGPIIGDRKTIIKEHIKKEMKKNNDVAKYI